MATFVLHYDYFDALITGYYCDAHGQTAMTAECAAGHYCTLGANTSTPTDGSTGNPKNLTCIC